MIFRNYGTPVRRTRRRKSQKMYFQEFWDSCAQSQTSEISTTALSGILGLLCAEQDVGNLKKTLLGMLGLLCAEQNVGHLKKCTLKNSGIPVRRTKRRQSQKHALLGTLGLLCAEQHVRNIKNCTFINSGTPVRRGGRPSAAPPLWFPLYWL